jgi:hypothetical protein
MAIRILYKTLYSCMFLVLCHAASGQRKNVSLKDSTDGNLDLSDFMIDANGFVPVPILITEPALGGFGGGIVPVFLKKRPPIVDEVRGKPYVTPVAPDITGGLAMYTANGTWMVAGFRRGTFVKQRIKYMIGGAYGDINLSFYRTVQQKGEVEFKFNGKIIPVFTNAVKKLGHSNWYAGFKYLFLKADLTYRGDPLLPPDFVKTREYNSIISKLGVIVELDNRDNVFTPDNGIKLHFDASMSDGSIGSDYDYTEVSYYTYLYKKMSRRLIGGLRIDGQQTFNDPPFFLLPYINMRGVQAARYQGNATILSEGELRWNFVERWSLILFGGAGKAFDSWDEFGGADWVGSYGSGFRYLIARKFQLRMGVDVAKGPDSWTYYIVFGSSWLK